LTDVRTSEVDAELPSVNVGPCILYADTSPSGEQLLKSQFIVETKDTAVEGS
jgi:hypothetical protein